MSVIDLSPSMEKRVVEWRSLGHELDVTLLHQCAYYPRSGCHECTFDSPKEDCKWSHIFLDTRINSPRVKGGRRGKKKINLELLLSKLPEEVREEIRRIAEGREGEKR